MPRLFAVARDRLREERGQSLVEVALIVPVVLVLIGGALDMGRLFYARISIENAAREGAMFAANNPRCDTAARDDCSDPNTADWRARNEATSLTGLGTSFVCLDGTTPRASVEDCMTGDSYTVTVTDTFDFVTPLLQPIFGSQLTLEASATARVTNTATDPDATPFPWPSAVPDCTVPLLKDLVVSAAEVDWVGAGFDLANFGADGIGDFLVVSQSLEAHTLEPCNSSVTVSDT